MRSTTPRVTYDVAPSADGAHLVFLSDEVAGAPRFRLTYDASKQGELGILFEIAAPGTTDFHRYVGGVAHRR